MIPALAALCNITSDISDSSWPCKIVTDEPSFPWNQMINIQYQHSVPLWKDVFPEDEHFPFLALYELSSNPILKTKGQLCMQDICNG